MANLVVCSGGQVKILEDCRVHYFNVECVLHLFKNNHASVRADTVSAYTECDFDGYSSQNMRSWGAAFDNGLSQAETDHPALVFTKTGVITTNTIYGYYVTDHLGNLLWAQNDPFPFTITSPGQTYTVTGQFLRADLP